MKYTNNSKGISLEINPWGIMVFLVIVKLLFCNNKNKKVVLEEYDIEDEDD